MDMNEQLGEITSTLRDRLVEIHGDRLVELVLFGSQARGDAEAGSDIDVLVVLDGEVDPGAEIARTGAVTAALSLEYDVVVSLAFASADRYRNETSPLMMNVRREGAPL
jgi:predicted nucleotidyltransferase